MYLREFCFTVLNHFLYHGIRPLYLIEDSVTGVSSVDRVNLGSRRPRQNFKALFLKKTKQTDHRNFKHCTSPLGFNRKFLGLMKGKIYYIGHKLLKVPVQSNFPKFMLADFSKVYVAVTYQAKQFFSPSTRTPFSPTVFLAILSPPLIDHVPTAQLEAWA